MTTFSRDQLATLLKDKLGSSRFSGQIGRALNLAYRGHSGQYRDQRENDESHKVPYIVHPIGVALLAHDLANLVNIDDNIDDLISACLTHDLLEDTEITPQILERETSKRTADLVLSLTKPPVMADATRQQRNERFLKQIVAAGRTAMFIKVCDHLHNISRPAQTPVHLLEKAIRKGRSSYLRLFDYGELSDELKGEYLRRMEVAEGYAWANKNQNDVRRQIGELSEAIRYCVSTGEKKILELHDVLEIIEFVFDARIVRTMSTAEFVDNVLFEKPPSQKERSVIERHIQKGELRISEIPNMTLGPTVKDVGRILALPLRVTDGGPPNRPEYLFVGLSDIRRADWMNSYSLRMIFVYLSERMRLQEKKTEGDLEAEIAKLGLSIGIEDAQKLQLTHKDLRELRSLLDYAAYVRNILTRAIEFELLDGRRDHDLPFVESRVKTAPSVVSKMSMRGFTSFAQVDDIVGIRIICASRNECRQVSQRVQNIVRKLHIFDVKEATDAQQPELSRNVSSSSGYKAVHLYFSCLPRESSEPGLGCEIQIRSVFQDAWARLSRHLSYKANRRASRNFETALKQLAEARDEADNIADDAVPHL